MLRDQTCTTRGPKYNCVVKLTFDETIEVHRVDWYRQNEPYGGGWFLMSEVFLYTWTSQDAVLFRVMYPTVQLPTEEEYFLLPTEEE